MEKANVFQLKKEECSLVCVDNEHGAMQIWVRDDKILMHTSDSVYLYQYGGWWKIYVGGPIVGCVLTSNDKLVVNHSRTVIQWDIETQSEVWSTSLNNEAQCIWNTSSDDIIVLQSNYPRLIHGTLVLLNNSGDLIRSLDVGIIHNVWYLKHSFISISANNVIRIGDSLLEQYNVLGLPHDVKEVCEIKDGYLIVSYRSEVLCYQPHTKHMRWRIDMDPVLRAGNYNIAVDRFEKYMAIATHRCMLGIYCTTTGLLLKRQAMESRYWFWFYNNKIIYPSESFLYEHDLFEGHRYSMFSFLHRSSMKTAMAKWIWIKMTTF